MCVCVCVCVCVCMHAVECHDLPFPMDLIVTLGQVGSEEALGLVL